MAKPFTRYRRLKVGETINAGDQWRERKGSAWHYSTMVGMTVGRGEKYRRLQIRLR